MKICVTITDEGCSYMAAILPTELLQSWVSGEPLYHILLPSSLVCSSQLTTDGVTVIIASLHAD